MPASTSADRDRDNADDAQLRRAEQTRAQTRGLLRVSTVHNSGRRERLGDREHGQHAQTGGS